MYLFGGLFLLWQRLITWHIPLAFLAGLAATAGVLHLIDPTQHATPLLHLFSGGAMLGAFFIATDPVTAASTPRGKLIYAGLAGLLTAIIRAFGGYPDGVAFAVLLMNVCVPFIDNYTQPRVFGHQKAKKA
jgi:electron transport complex protein RnfD